MTIGCVAGLLAWWTRARVTGFSDFDLMWLVDRAIMRRADPFSAAHLAYAWPRPMLYPLPAAIVALPFAALPQSLAPGAFSAAGFTLLAFGLTRDAWWPLIALASLPAVESAQLGQWSPFFAAIALFPTLSFLAIVKPTTAGACASAYLPRTGNIPAILVALGLLAAATFVTPGWVVRWSEAIRTPTRYLPLAVRPFGLLLLLALLKWRRPEARLIAFLALVPLSGMAYDALVLAVVPRSRGEALLLAVPTFVAVPWRAVAQDDGAAFAAATSHNALMYLATLYLPALMMVLRRPNETPAGLLGHRQGP